MTSGASAIDVLQRVSQDIGLVEAALERQIHSSIQEVDQVGRHTLAAGGKRLRPAFVLLAARAVGGDRLDLSRAVELGACLETIHMATLIHDDVIDHAGTRRGRPTASSLFGNTASILAGDVLLARAMCVLAEDGDLEIIRTVSSAVVEMAEGEALELALRGRFDLSEAEHLDVLQRKTAALVRCCCEVGALVGGAGPEGRQALADYGWALGLAFQIVDDLLDFRGGQTGKPQGADFREGCATLPLIYLRESLTEEEIAFANRKFGNGVTDDEIRMIVGWMETRGAFAKAESLADQHASDARLALQALPANDERATLEAAIDFVLHRNR